MCHCNVWLPEDICHWAGIIVYHQTLKSCIWKNDIGKTMADPVPRWYTHRGTHDLWVMMLAGSGFTPLGWFTPFEPCLWEHVSDKCIYIFIYIYIYTYTLWLLRIECRLRTIVYSHIIRHSRIQCQRGISNWPLWLKSHCSTRTKNCHAEADARVTSSLEHLLQIQLPEHNRTGNLRFSIHTYIHTYVSILEVCQISWFSGCPFPDNIESCWRTTNQECRWMESMRGERNLIAQEALQATIICFIGSLQKALCLHIWYKLTIHKRFIPPLGRKIISHRFWKVRIAQASNQRERAAHFGDPHRGPRWTCAHWAHGYVTYVACPQIGDWRCFGKWCRD